MNINCKWMKVKYGNHAFQNNYKHESKHHYFPLLVWEQPPRHLEVVGGSDKGGILVRKGQDLKSEQCADRGSAWPWVIGRWWKTKKTQSVQCSHVYNYIYIYILWEYISIFMIIYIILILYIYMLLISLYSYVYVTHCNYCTYMYILFTWYQ